MSIAFFASIALSPALRPSGSSNHHRKTNKPFITMSITWYSNTFT
ncbi:hypothetical protein F441_05925, partial [Phytophthora nicotianae CJ01A1]